MRVAPSRGDPDRRAEREQARGRADADTASRRRPRPRPRRRATGPTSAPSAQALFMIPNASPWERPGRIGAVRRQRHARRVEAAEADACEAPRARRSGRPRSRCERHRSRARTPSGRSSYGPQRPDSIDQATENRVDERLERDRDEEDQRDREASTSRRRRARAARARSSIPKSIAGSAFSQSPPDEASVVEGPRARRRTRASRLGADLAIDASTAKAEATTPTVTNEARTPT